MHKSDATLNAADRAKLAKLLGMIGSQHDGEALNAARMADRLVRARALRWTDILDLPAMPSPRDDLAGHWREAAESCVLYGADVLTDWEREFCRSLAGFARCSDKQLVTLRRLVDKVRLGETVT